MTWRDQLRRVTLPDGRRLIGASFRGVPFFVAVSTRTGGRRTVTHEFPGRDDPYLEDHGRRARTFPVEGYVIGDDYIAQRDALLAALEDSPGPAELVHPYYGTLRACCTALTVIERSVDGGMAVFALEFSEAPAQALAPTDQPDLSGEVKTKSDLAVDAVLVEFDQGYDVEGQPAFALESLADEVGAVATKLSETLAAAVAAGQDVEAATQELARMNADLTVMTAQAAALVRHPDDLFSGLRTAIATLAETAEAAPRAVITALVEAYGTEPQPVALGTTATRAQERANQAALAAALRRVLAIEAARLLPAVDYETHEDAVADRDTVAELLDEQALTAGDDAYPALVELRAAVVRGVPGDAELARLVTVDQRVNVPSLLLSYRLYGSVELEADILARNRVRHPGFLGGPLVVLTGV